MMIGGRALPNFYKYTALAGDTFDSIALDFYGQENISTFIIRENPSYRNTLIFKGGEVLYIPIIEQQIPTSLPPWKQVNK